MAGFTKEQLSAKAREQIAFCRNTKITGEGRAHVNQCSALFEIALAALTVNPTPAPELKMAELINKFYERYPLETFKSDTERSAALGYFMAGAELQCFGEFINYADLAVDE